MLKYLDIRDFRSVASTGDTPLEFGRVNLFIGPNGAGKSNVLEAIGVLSAALGRGIGPRDLEERGVRLSLPKLFKAAFRGKKKIPGQFSLTAGTESCSYTCAVSAGDASSTLTVMSEKLEVDGARIFGKNVGGKQKVKVSDDALVNEAAARAKPEPTESLYAVLKAFLPLSDIARYELDALAKYAIYAPQTAVLRGLAEDRRQASPLGLTGAGLAAAFNDLLYNKARRNSDQYRKAVARVISLVNASGWVRGIGAGPHDAAVVPEDEPKAGQPARHPEIVYFHDRYMVPKRSMLSAYDASEGALYLLFVAVLLNHPESPNIFALDNVDGTLNPGMVRKLVRYICDAAAENAEKQVFMTSHNPTALDELDLFNPDHKVYVVHRGEDGGTRFFPLKPNPSMTREDWEAEYKGRNLSRLWVDGEIPYALGED